MKADAILFDKDGTLTDFDAFWVPITEKAICATLAQLGAEAALAGPILEAIGVHNGVTDVDSVLCKGTYGQIGQVVHEVLRQHGVAADRDAVAKQIEKAYEDHMDAGQVQPTCPDLKEVLEKLKERGKHLAVVTTDNAEVTAFCLKKLGIEQLFDRIYTDDGTFPPKPDPYCAHHFCDLLGIGRDRAVMVGDTLNDVRFARNAGIQVVGVAAGEENRRLLTGQADLLVSSLSELPDVLV